MWNKIKNYITNLFKINKPSIIIPSNLDHEQLPKKYCELNFILDEKLDGVDIQFLYPKATELSVEQIATIAECCASLIVCINTGQFKKQITKLLIEDKKHHMNDDKTTLLLDNIIFFQKILYEEFETYKKSNGPLIKPSSVFKSTY